MTRPAGPSTDVGNLENTASATGHGHAGVNYLAIGRIVRAHGTRGEVSVAVLTDYPERFEQTEWVFVGNAFEAEPYRLEQHRWHKQNVLLTLAGITTRAQAKQLQGQLVQIPIEQAMPLLDDEYYLFQIVGLQVVTVDGQPLGIVADVLETKANDVYIVESPDGKEILLPAIPDVVKAVDLDSGRITVALLDGLI